MPDTPTNRLIPAPRHLGILSQLPWDRAPLTSGSALGVRHLRPHSQLYWKWTPSINMSSLDPVLPAPQPLTLEPSFTHQWASTSLGNQSCIASHFVKERGGWMSSFTRWQGSGRSQRKDNSEDNAEQNHFTCRPQFP